MGKWPIISLINEVGSWPIFFLLQDLGSCPIFLYITNKAHNPYFSISWSTEHCACYFLFAFLIDGLPNKSSNIHKNCLWTRDVQLLVIWHSLKVTHTHTEMNNSPLVGPTKLIFFFLMKMLLYPFLIWPKVAFIFYIQTQFFGYWKWKMIN